MKTLQALKRTYRHWHFNDTQFYGYFGLVVVATMFYTLLAGF